MTDGFWAMIRPLPPGVHTLHFGGSFSGLGVFVDMTYHVTVL